MRKCNINNLLNHLKNPENDWVKKLYIVFKNKQSYQLITRFPLIGDDELKNYDDEKIIAIEEFIDILENLKQQKPQYTPGDALNALKFYVDNDAFIEM